MTRETDVLPANLTLERASPANVDLLLAIHEDAARWLWSRGIRQWEPGKYPREVMAGWAERGEAYIARLGGELVGMVILQESDDFMWPGASPDALYVHGLRVLRAFAGQGLGRAILRWAEREAVARGKAYLRLDVMADNPRIRAYYESAGFEHVRDVHDKPWPGSLYEKQIELPDVPPAESWSVETPAGGFTLAKATVDDAETVADILEDAAVWLWGRGIRQWVPGTGDDAALAARIARGEVYLARHGGDPAATLTLQWRDEETWGPMPDDAGYVHGLAVRRLYGGRGLGRALLAWAEDRARAAGRAYLRLDCMAKNAALRAYYEGAGFTERMDVPHDDWSALYEKRVGSA